MRIYMGLILCALITGCGSSGPAKSVRPQTKPVAEAAQPSSEEADRLFRAADYQKAYAMYTAVFKDIPLTKLNDAQLNNYAEAAYWTEMVPPTHTRILLEAAGEANPENITVQVFLLYTLARIPDYPAAIKLGDEIVAANPTLFHLQEDIKSLKQALEMYKAIQALPVKEIVRDSIQYEDLGDLKEYNLSFNQNAGCMQVLADHSRLIRIYEPGRKENLEIPIKELEPFKVVSVEIRDGYVLATAYDQEKERSFYIARFSGTPLKLEKKVEIRGSYPGLAVGRHRKLAYLIFEPYAQDTLVDDTPFRFGGQKPTRKVHLLDETSLEVKPTEHLFKTVNVYLFNKDTILACADSGLSEESTYLKIAGDGSLTPETGYQRIGGGASFTPDGRLARHMFDYNDDYSKKNTNPLEWGVKIWNAVDKEDQRLYVTGPLVWDFSINRVNTFLAAFYKNNSELRIFRLSDAQPVLRLRVPKMDEGWTIRGVSIMPLPGETVVFTLKKENAYRLALIPLDLAPFFP